MMKMKIWLLSSLSVVITLFVFSQSLHHFIIKSTVQAYVKAQWNHSFTCEAVYQEDNQFVFVKPHFKKMKIFECEKMILAYKWDLWKRDFFLAVVLEKPKIHLEKMDSKGRGFHHSGDLFSFGKGWIHFHPHIVVDQGILTWSEQDHSPLHFNVSFDNLVGGQLSAHFDEEDRIDLQALRHEEEMDLSIHCLNLNCPRMMDLLKTLFPFLDVVSIPSGQLNGEIEGHFTADQRPQLSGHLVIEDMEFTDHSHHLSGAIQKAELQIEKNVELKDDQRSVAKLVLLEPARIEYATWKIDQLMGSIDLNAGRTGTLFMKGIGKYLDQDLPLQLEGTANLNGQRDLNLDLHLLFSTVQSSEGKIHLSIKQETPTSHRVADVQIEKLSASEAGFLQTLMIPFWPALNELIILKGRMNASLQADLDNHSEKLVVKEFLAEDFQFKLNAYQSLCSFESVSGQGMVDFAAPSIRHSLNGELHLNDGSLSFQSGIHPQLAFTSIQTHLNVMNGEIPHSVVTLELGGLKGTMDIEWGTPKNELITFRLLGKVNDLADLFPKRATKRWSKLFKEDEIGIFANLKRGENQRLELAGTAHVHRSKSDDFDLIHFGFEIDKTQGFYIPTGWFYARHLPLEKYLSPFLFRAGVLEMSGSGEFKGSLNHPLLTIKYDLEQLKLENEHLLIEAAHLKSEIPGEFIATHEIDLSDYSHHGQLPLQHAAYHEKKSGLDFEDMSGTVHFKNKTLSIKSMEAYCCDVYFAGALDLDYSDPAPGVFNLAIHSPTITGKVSQVEQLLSHLNAPAFFNRFLLEGDFVGRNKGLELGFDFHPVDYDLKTDLEASIIHGSLPFESGDMSLKGLTMDVDYHHTDQILKFSDIQGSLLVGKPRCVEEYLFVGHHLLINDLKKQDIDVDLSVFDHKDELLRIVAKSNEEPSGLRNITLDHQLTHLSHLYPQAFQCCFQEGELQTFHIESKFELPLLLQDLSRFENTGLFCLSHYLLDKLNLLNPVEGQVDLKITYDVSEGAMKFVLMGEDLKIHTKTPHQFLMKGKALGKKWILDQLRWDQLNLFAELQNIDKMWRIHSLGFNNGESILLGLQGDLSPEEGRLNAQVNLCQIDLKELCEWTSLDHRVSTWQPRGVIQATGVVGIEVLSEAPWFRFQTSLDVRPTELALKEYTFTNPEPFHFNLKTHQEGFLASLGDGHYLLNGKSYALHDIEINKSGEMVGFAAKSLYRNCPFGIISNTHWPDATHGSVTLIDDLFKTTNSSLQPLTIQWMKNSNSELFLNSLQGHFSGFWCDLYQVDKKMTEPKTMTALEGTIDIDFNSICPLLTDEVADKIKSLELGSFYTLMGHYLIDPLSEKEWSDQFCFKGQISSQDAIFKGYQLSRLEADLNYVPKRLEIRDLKVDDPSGSLRSPNFHVFQGYQADEWSFHIPQIIIKKLKPNLLREPRQGRNRSSLFKALMVKKIEFQNLNGNLGDSNTWKGKGGLHFQNTTRKNASHPILAIPGEIILRLGLDPHVLNPVTGSIYFDLHEGRFYLTKMKDVYSEGRGSKFYLAEKTSPSWMDLEGNLSLQIRMKQYNLIFKIAELFTVSVQGNIKKPTYALQKQSKR